MRRTILAALGLGALGLLTLWSFLMGCLMVAIFVYIFVG
jgi:hypothetical protein